MAKVKLALVVLLVFLKRLYNKFGNILPQNKNIEVDSVRQVCLIQPILKNFVTKNYQNSDFGFCFLVRNTNGRSITFPK